MFRENQNYFSILSLLIDHTGGKMTKTLLGRMYPRSIIYILMDVMLLIQFSLWYELSSALISVNQPRRSERALCLAITQKTRWKELERWNGLFGIRTYLYKHLRQDEKRWNMKAVKNLNKMESFSQRGRLNNAMYTQKTECVWL